jgi:pimeloyl-ACP methyl ester carboxylesterase
MNLQDQGLDDQAAVLEETVPGSRKLILAFGGIKGALGMPTFEFYQSSSIINENRIFFRDFSQQWYHSGLRGMTRNVPETANYIRMLINRIAPEEVIFIGNSMGGFAAILFSTLLDIGRVVSFSPQTFISPLKRLSTGDTRWKWDVLDTYRASLLKPKYYDLRHLLDNSPRHNQIDIYASSLDRLDMLHAKEISDFSNVHLHVYEVGGHRLVKDLRDAGLLQEILLGNRVPTTIPFSGTRAERDREISEKGHRTVQ